MASISAWEWQTQVRCEMAVRVVSRWIRQTRSWVRSRVLPPAPYVTETNDGCSSWSWVIVPNSSSHASSLFGGKNSKLKVVWCCRKISRMCMVPHNPWGGGCDDADCDESAATCQGRIGLSAKRARLARQDPDPDV